MKPAPNSVIPRTPVRTGKGSVGLIGTFTGHDPAVFEIVIDSDSATTKTISAPTFVGTGNGAISAITATGLAAQEFTVELYDLGTTTAAAQIVLYDAVIQHVTPGTAGNATRITVDASGIILTDSIYATFSDLAAGTTTVTGSQWDWGALPLDALGNMDSASLRFLIGNDPQVYRVSKSYSDGIESFSFTPPIQRNIPAGSRIRTVTGSYSVSVIDGINPDEDHASIITIYDFLSSILTTSAILTVITPVGNDLSPGGISTIDLPLRSAPWIISVAGEGSSYVEALTEPDLVITLDAAHPTEELTLTCKNNSIVTREEWEVSGPISGTRSTRAVTGEAYDDPEELITLTVPARSVPDEELGIRLERFEWATRTGGEYQPPIMIRDMTLGRAAVTKTLTLTYTAKPNQPAGCDPTNQSVEGNINPDWLGLTEETTGGDAAVLQKWKEHLDMLYDWAQTFMAANTELINSTGDIPRDPFIYNWTAQLSYDRVDIKFCKMISDLFRATLTKIASCPSNTAEPWATLTAYAVDDIVQPTTPNDHYYRCSIAGTSGVGEPVWGTAWGENADGTVIWQDMGLKPIVLWKTHFDAMVVYMTPLNALDAGAFWKDAGVRLMYTTVWQSAHAYAKNDIVIPTTYNGYYYMCISNGVSGATEPLWPRVNGDHVTDGMAIWNTFTIAMADDITTFRVTDDRLDYCLQQFVAQMKQVEAAGDLDPSPFSEASTGISSNYVDTSQCWLDQNVSHYWEINDGEYLPAFTGVMYHAAKSKWDPIENEDVPFATREFAFSISVACTQYLKTGDKIILQITAAQKTYQVGDVITIPVIAGSPAALTGGLTGTDDLTWRVTGSVTGAFADHVLNKVTPLAYSDSGLGFMITPGAIDFALGDLFSFSIEEGTFVWRKDGGAWSASTDISDSLLGVVLSDGLSALFTPGATLSFAVLDNYIFDVLQPYSQENTKYPDPSSLNWQWIGATVNCIWDLGGSYSFTTFVIIHDLLSTATITIEGSDDNFATVLWTTGAITWRDLVITHVPAAALIAKFLRLTLTGATDGKIYYFGAGLGALISQPCRDCILDHQYQMQAGMYLGKSRGGSIEWGNFLVGADADAVIAMADWAKGNDDEPVILIPNFGRPELSRVVRLADNLLEITDRYQYHPSTEHETHRYSAKRLKFNGVSYGN